MGITSPKTTISVATVAYNMAGDAANRPDYLKTVVLSSVLSDDERFLGQDIVNAHLNGPGIAQRTFFRWADANFSLGMPGTKIQNTYEVASADVIGELTAPVGQTIEVQSAFIEVANIYYYAENYLWINNPELVNTAWICDYDEVLGEVFIQHADTSTVSFAQSFDKDGDMLVIYYVCRQAETLGTLSSGAITYNEYVFASVPDTTGYTQLIDTLTPSGDTLTERTQVLVEYSDATPDEYSDTNDGGIWTPYGEKTEVYRLETYQGGTGTDESVTTLRNYINIWKRFDIASADMVGVVVEDIGGGVTKTTTTTVTTETLQPVWDYSEDTQNVYGGAIADDTKMVVYEMGSGGNATFDALQNNAVSPPSEFFPFIPIRLDGLPIDDASFDFYDDCSVAYKKGTGAKLEDLMVSVADNPDIDDVDFCFLVWGVSLNTNDNSGKLYIYEFLKTLIPYQNTSGVEYTAFLAAHAAHTAAETAYVDWLTGQTLIGDPLYGTARPSISSLVRPEGSTLITNSNDIRVPGYDQRIEYVNIDEEIIAGLGKVGAKVGELWWEDGTPDTWTENYGKLEEGTWVWSGNQEYSISNAYLFYQTSATEYRKLTVRGMSHVNYVYKTKSVNITVSEALADSEESGFIVPLHYPTLKSISLVDSTQMTTCNVYLLFNSYEVTKQKWYQTGLFKIILVIAIIAVSIYFAPAGSVGGGVLGSNVFVGELLGFAGTSALIVGAIANALAAMIIAKMVTTASVALFGEKIGGIIGAIATFVVLQAGTSFMNGGKLGLDWGSMMRAENLMKLTKVGVNAYAEWANADIVEMQKALENAQEDYEKTSDEIKELASELGLLDVTGIIDPMMFTEILKKKDFVSESSSEFVERTTMTGEDIIDISLSMIYDYAELNITLPDSV